MSNTALAYKKRLTLYEAAQLIVDGGKGMNNVLSLLKESVEDRTLPVVELVRCTRYDWNIGAEVYDPEGNADVRQTIIERDALIEWLTAINYQPRPNLLFLDNTGSGRGMLKSYFCWLAVEESKPVKFSDLAHMMAKAMHPSETEAELMRYAAARTNLQEELPKLAQSGELIVRNPAGMGKHTFPYGDALNRAVILPLDLKPFLEARGMELRLMPHGSGPEFWTLENAAIAIAKQEGWHNGARATLLDDMKDAADRQELRVRDPQTDLYKTSGEVRTFYELVTPADVNAWLEKRGATYRWNIAPQNSSRCVPRLQVPMYSRLVPRTSWSGGRMADTDFLTLDEAACFASKHAKTEISVKDFLRAASRGEIKLCAVVHRQAKVQKHDGGVYCNAGQPTENIIPRGSIPTLPISACRQLANTQRASWRTFDGEKMIDGELMRYEIAHLTDDELDFETSMSDCRVTGYDVHALADEYINASAEPSQQTAPQVGPAKDKNNWTDAALKQLRQEYKEGSTQEQLAEKHNCTRQNIGKLLKKADEKFGTRKAGHFDAVTAWRPKK